MRVWNDLERPIYRVQLSHKRCTNDKTKHDLNHIRQFKVKCQVNLVRSDSLRKPYCKDIACDKVVPGVNRLLMIVKLV